MMYLLIASAVFVPVIHGFLINVTEIVERINSEVGTWTADTYGFTLMDTKYVKNRLGLKSRHGSLGFYYPRHRSENLSASGVSATDSPPENFSWLEGNSTSGNYGCPIGNIKDQANCGCCWAASTTGAFGDRWCIATKGREKTLLSYGYQTTCDKKNEGCDGGYLDRAHEFLVKNGLVTGGNYDSKEGCQPYFLPPCSGGGCTSEAKTPECMGDECSNNAYPYKMEPKRTKASKWYQVRSSKSMAANENTIMKEIQENGPVAAGLKIYSDFMNYKSGIYQRRSNRFLGYHAVRMIGWGKQNGVKYWLTANSWGTSWGEKGFARILRGRNEVGIEGSVVTAIPQFN